MEAEAAREEEEAKNKELAKMELEERKQLHEFVDTSKPGVAISTRGYLLGVGWRNMNEQDAAAAGACEIDINHNEKLKQQLPKTEGFMIVRYEGRRFALARHSNGMFRVLGIPDFKLQARTTSPRVVVTAETTGSDPQWNNA